MRIGRYKIYYDGELIGKVWSINKVYELVANMIKCGFDKEKITYDYTDIGLLY